MTRALSNLMVLTACAALTACGDNFSHMMRGAAIRPVANELALELTQTNSTVDSTNVAFGVKFVLSFTNRGKTPIGLDGRLLNPVLLTQISSDSNESIYNVPPSVPRAPQQSEILFLEPGKSLQLTFTLGAITMYQFGQGPYFAQCCYQTSNNPYPADWKAWQGRACSERLQIVFGKSNKSTGNGTNNVIR